MEYASNPTHVHPPLKGGGGVVPTIESHGEDVVEGEGQLRDLAQRWFTPGRLISPSQLDGNSMALGSRKQIHPHLIHRLISIQSEIRFLRPFHYANVTY